MTSQPNGTYQDAKKKRISKHDVTILAVFIIAYGILLASTILMFKILEDRTLMIGLSFVSMTLFLITMIAAVIIHNGSESASERYRRRYMRRSYTAFGMNIHRRTG